MYFFPIRHAAEAVDARFCPIDRGEEGGIVGEGGEVRVDNVDEFWVGKSWEKGAAGNGYYGCYGGVCECVLEDGVADMPGGAEEDDLHRWTSDWSGEGRFERR